VFWLEAESIGWLDYRSAFMMQATDTMAITFGKADALKCGDLDTIIIEASYRC
jgi:hypothetical protein